MQPRRAAARILFAWMLVSACAHKPNQVEPPPVRLLAVQVTPIAPVLAAGTRVRLTATGSYSNGTVRDLTAVSTWTSGNLELATVGPGGEVAALKAGVVEVTATVIGVAGSTRVTVTGATLSSIGVAPAVPSIALGTTVQLTATGTFNDGTTQDLTYQVVWESVDASVATVSNLISTRGLAAAVRPGTTAVSAVLGAVSGSTSLTVTAARLVGVAVTPAAASLAKGSTLKLVATGSFTDRTTQDVTAQAVWSSSRPASATVSSATGSAGLGTAHAPGSAVLTAAVGTVSGSTAVTVTPAQLVSLAVAPLAPSLPRGLTRQLSAIGTFTDGSTRELTNAVTWSSSAPAVADVSNAASSQGLVTALGLGSSTITATSGTVSASTVLMVTSATLSSLAVTAPAASRAKGLTVQLTATATYSDGTQQNLTDQVTWSSSDPLTVAVSNAGGWKGLATALAVGSANLTAQLGAVSGVMAVVVTPAELLSLTIGGSAPGLPLGLSRQLSATGRYTDATEAILTAQVSWASSSPAVAQVSDLAASKGLVTSVGLGSASISATFGAVVGSVPLVVTNALLNSISVSSSAPSVAKGLTAQLTATGTYSDGSEQDLTAQVTWSSSDPLKVAVSNIAGLNGLATALAVGSATLSAQAGPVVGSVPLSVVPAQLTTLTISGASPELPVGLTQQLAATGRYTDGTEANLTTVVSWTSTSPAVALVSNLAGTQGLVTSVGVGSGGILATLGPVVGSVALTVTNAQLVSLAVVPGAPSLAKGLAMELTASGTFTDGSIRDLSWDVGWSSSAPSVATVTNGPVSKGRLQALTTGTTTVSAAFGAFLATAVVTVVPAQLVSITVAFSAAYLPVGLFAPFTAQGLLTDGSTLDVTAQVVWTTSDASIAQVSNSPGTEGRVTGVQAGQATITATLGVVAGDKVLVVAPPVITSLSLSPAAASVAIGQTQQFTAIATLSNGTTRDLSVECEWVSLDPSVATVSNLEGSAGRATAVAAGGTTIQAECEQFFAPATLTVVP